MLRAQLRPVAERHANDDGRKMEGWVDGQCFGSWRVRFTGSGGGHTHDETNAPQINIRKEWQLRLKLLRKRHQCHYLKGLPLQHFTQPDMP